MRDPHEILGVTRAATEAEIKRAFRRKAKQCHPDTHPNDPVIEREFRDLVSAYHEALKRARAKSAPGAKSFSEQLKRAHQNPSNWQTSPPRTRPEAEEFRYQDTVDLSHNRPGNTPPQTKNASANPTGPSSATIIPEVVKNFWKDNIIGRFESMVRQNIDPAHRRTDNPDVNSQATNAKGATNQNTGKKSDQKVDQKTGGRRDGIDHYYELEVGFIEARTGTKKTLVLKNGRQINVMIAPETREAQVLRLGGMGFEGSRNRNPGDALVTIKIIDDQFSERSGNDFFLRLPVSLAEAVLGGEIIVPGLYQDNRMTIPPNSSSGTNLRLKGQGFLSEDSSRKRKKDRIQPLDNQRKRGDQYVTLEIKLPPAKDKSLHAFVTGWVHRSDYDVRQNIGMGALDSTTKTAHNHND